MSRTKKWLLSSVFIFASVTETVVWAGAGEASFTPTSVIIPIRMITLENGSSSTSSVNFHGIGQATSATDGGSGSGTLYSCSESSSDCTSATPSTCCIDVADNTALAALAAKATSVGTGTYDRIAVSTCLSEGSYSGRVKGSVSIGGTTYYTASGSAPLTATQSGQDYTVVPFTGCTQRYALPTKKTIAQGDKVTMSLFLTVKNIAFAKTNGTFPLNGGCKTDNTRSVCMAYPDLVPVLDTGDPTLEAYHICEGASCSVTAAGGQVLLLFNSASVLLGGFTRRLYSATSTSMAFYYDTAFKTPTKNSDGSYTLENYGSSYDGTGYLKFSSFSRVSAVGGTASGNYTKGDGTSSTAFTATWIQ